MWPLQVLIGRVTVVALVAVGTSVAWTRWTNVEQSAHSCGATRVPARSDLTADRALFLLSIGFAPFR